MTKTGAPFRVVTAIKPDESQMGVDEVTVEFQEAEPIKLTRRVYEVHTILISPRGKYSLKQLLDDCRLPLLVSKKLDEARLQNHLSRQVRFNPHETPVVFLKLDEETTAEGVEKFRTKQNGNYFYPAGLFDLLLQCLAAEPEFFAGKKVVDIDTKIEVDGVTYVPFIDGIDPCRFKILVDEQNTVWPANTWFVALCQRAANRPGGPNRFADVKFTE